MRFKNFQIWRGRLPHWRADEVRYYTTFRHRRPLDEDERRTLFAHLLKASGNRYDVFVLCVLPEVTELMFRMREDAKGRPFELAAIIEGAKRKAGKAIVKDTGERYPPFYTESYDRIVRDDAEFEERWLAIVGSPVDAELADEPEDYECLWVAPEA